MAGRRHVHDASHHCGWHDIEEWPRQITFAAMIINAAHLLEYWSMNMEQRLQSSHLQCGIGLDLPMA